MTSKPLRHRVSHAEPLRRLTGAAGGGLAHEIASAASLLGDDHRLVRTLDVLAVLRRQLLLSSTALAASALAIAAGSSRALAVIVAAALVEFALASAIVALRPLRRALARELIISGHGDLPLRTPARERQRLTSPRTQADLARVLERIIQTAANWSRIFPTARPVFDPRQVRAATPLLKALAEQLSAQPAQPRAVALIERLLTSAHSPLYSQQPDELRRELELIHHALGSDRAHRREKAP